jgi:hypothetical protein
MSRSNLPNSNPPLVESFRLLVGHLSEKASPSQQRCLLRQTDSKCRRRKQAFSNIVEEYIPYGREEIVPIPLRPDVEGSRGELLDASELLELLDVFGEDGARSYLVGYLEGVDDAMEEEDE